MFIPPEHICISATHIKRPSKRKEALAKGKEKKRAQYFSFKAVYLANDVLERLKSKPADVKGVDVETTKSKD